MALLSVRDLTHAFGGPPVLAKAQLQVERGDRIALFGRNGEGKSTLMKLMAGTLLPDSGGVDVMRGATVGALTQEVPEAESGTVFEVVSGGLGELGRQLQRYHDAVARVAADPSPQNLARLEREQHELEVAGGWEVEQRVETVLTRLTLDGEAPFATLSGGWRRRAFLARALVLRPDVLLLDEPTNHLDIDAIRWLEESLVRFEGALVFVSHDRAFVRAVATRIVELDRGKLVEYPGRFDDYVAAKAHALDVEATHDAEFDKKLADEEVWIRTGIKARRTRNEGRVRALERLRRERAERRDRKGRASFSIQSAEQSGRVVIEAKGVSFGYGDTPLVTDLDLRILRGDRVALLGPNGAGKTTLLRILLGELAPQRGTVTLGTKLQVRYYDQLREQLDPNKRVADSVVEDGDTVELDGRRRHVIGYLREFLFDDAQARSPVAALSGGERNRLMLAKLFASPANVLVLDEPTNDLDVETLELLEDRLLDFPGTVLLVSHDREFVNNLVTESLVFEGRGIVTRLVGGYDEWDRLREAERASREAVPAPAPANTAPAPKSPPKKRSKREREELDALPERIEGLEREKESLHSLLADASLYRTAPERVTTTRARLAALEAEIAALFARWEALELDTGS